MFKALHFLMEDAMELIHTRLADTADVAREVHAEIYQSVATGDAETAVRTMRQHLEDFAARLQRLGA
jgi:DNA-binding FadR family transcriptional regulator